MKIVYRIYHILLLLCIISILPLFGETHYVKKVGRVRTDNSYVRVRQPVEKKIKEYRDSDDFIYERHGHPLTFMSDIKRWIIEKLRDIFGTFEGKSILDYTAVRIILIIFFALLMAYFILRILRLRVFYKPRVVVSGAEIEYIEDIASIDFDALIDQHQKKKMYREAIRLLYHRSLKQLSEKEFIQWKSFKTNRDYIEELDDGVLKNAFKELTRLFEYTWYGNFILDRSAFGIMQKKFYEFTNLII